MPASAIKSIKINTILCKIKIAGCGIFSNQEDLYINIQLIYVHVIPNHFQVVKKKWQNSNNG